MTFRIPDQLRESKERWWVIFSNASLIASLVAFGIGLVVRALLAAFGLKLVGTIICGALVLFAFLIFTISVPKSNVLGGGGLLIGEVMYKKFLHKRNADIYITIWEEEDDEDATVVGSEERN